MQIEIGFRAQVEQYRVSPVPPNPRSPTKTTSDTALSSTKVNISHPTFDLY
jgi:hypothetical protein